MTGTEIYRRAITSLGYTDNETFKGKALININQIYDELYPVAGKGEHKPIAVLSDEVALGEKASSGAVVYGLAERLAMGEGDGELQQYFALRFDRAKARLNRIDRVEDVMPRGIVNEE